MTSEILDELNSSPTIIIRCPDCADEFPASRGELFDATEPLPLVALQSLAALRKRLCEERAAHRLHVERAKQRTNVAARATNIGKVVEKIAPSLAGFPEHPAECRSLFEPIDLVVFRGLLRGLVESVVMVDVKSGRARLSKRQQQIRDLVDSGKVTLHVVAAETKEEHA